MKTGIALAALVFLLACGSTPPPVIGPVRSTVTPSSLASPPAAGVKDCGTFTIEQGKGLPAEAVSCFLDAVKAKQLAQLQETRPTIEGDPIFTRYLSRADGNVEVTRDTRLDTYGQRLIAREVCVGTSLAPITGILIFIDCAPA